MDMIRNMLITIASIAIIIYVSDAMATKYKTDENMVSCSNNDVQDLLIDVVSKDAKESIEKQGFIFKANVIKENTTTEDRKMTIGNKVSSSLSISRAFKSPGLLSFVPLSSSS